MKAALAALTLLAGTAASKVDPQTAAAFRVAFGKSDSAIIKYRGEMKEEVKYTPGGIVEAPFGPVLISPGEVLNYAHVSSGKIAAIYMRRTPGGFVVTKRFVPAAETGSFGEITSWEASHAFGLPMLSVYGSGTWQGYTCIWTTLVELAPDKPRELVTVPVHYDDEGAFEGPHKNTDIDGKIANIVAGRSFDVVYSGSKHFTERYLRRGNKYVVARGKSRMPTC